jgi:predicted Zn-dependent protease with MMP-like domain
MNRDRFEQLVASAVESLPEEFRTRLENITITVEDSPTPEQLSKMRSKRGYTLLGLYEGIPLTKRTHSYGMAVPDKITIFQKPIESKCRDDDEITAEIKRVVQHEIAHHFGIGDAKLREIELSRLLRLDVPQH